MLFFRQYRFGLLHSMHRIALVMAALALFVTACGDDAAPAPLATPPAESPTASPVSTACTPTRPHESGTFRETIAAGGLEREYILYIPPSYSGDNAVPLIINLHGFGSNARQQAAYSGLPAKAKDAGFIIVTPQGTGSQPHWNFTTVEPGAPDDVAFIGDLLDKLESQLCLDRARVYATGISNGAAMSVRLACDLSDRIAAIAPVAGMHFPRNCSATRSVPVIAFHGTDDNLVPFEGGQVLAGLGLTVRPVKESAAAWARHNGCASSPKEERVTEHVQLVSYQDCKEGATVNLYIIEGGHTWPGSAFDAPYGATTQEISAADLIWAFFEAHPKR